ncbi:MAG: methyltransferase domain-containing protein [Pseudomonadota bacterium]
MSETAQTDKLEAAYAVEDVAEARAFYDTWAEGYDEELARNDYRTPDRAAEALAAQAADRGGALADFGCGTGLSGQAFAAAGFTVIDGYDLSPGMLQRAGEKGVYRRLALCDLSQPLEIEDGAYANAAAVGALNPQFMPPTVIDEILRVLSPGGCFVFSINDRHNPGPFEGRVMDLTDCGYAELLVREKGGHLPGIGLESTLYLLRRR